MTEEVLQYLPVGPEGVYVDGTVGGGGHALAIARRLGPKGMLLGLDRDPQALAEARVLLAECGERVQLRRGDFGCLPRLLRDEGLGRIRGVLLDLGVSSHQLDEAGRGFSFLRDGPLDMRMDPGRGKPASTLVNELEEAELVRILREYGEEPRAPRVARAIGRERARQPILTTGALAAVIEKALGRRSGKHPATRSFQALRIAVNGEMESLEACLRALPEVLTPGGRAVVISYHSLEDRRVKLAFREGEPHCRCPPRAPRCVCGCPGVFRVLTRKAIRPSPGEIEKNPRARSARLRAAERLTATPGPRPTEGGRA